MVKWELFSIVTDVKGSAIKVKEKTLEVFTIPESKLFVHLTLLNGSDPFLFDGRIKEVRLIHNDEVLSDTAKAWADYVGLELPLDDEIRFTVCSPEVGSAELAELIAKQSARLEIIAKQYREGKITATRRQAMEEKMVEDDSSSFKEYYIEVRDIVFIHKKIWPRVGQKIKITKVELANDGVEFTMVRV